MQLKTLKNRKIFSIFLIFVWLGLWKSPLMAQVIPKQKVEQPGRIKNYNPKKNLKHKAKVNQKRKEAQLKKERKMKRLHYKHQPPDAKKRLRIQKRKSRRLSKGKPSVAWWAKYLHKKRKPRKKTNTKPTENG